MSDRLKKKRSQIHTLDQNDSEYSKDEEQSYFSHQTQIQSQLQQQRSAQASAQMVYDVYGNLIAILEEYEQREIRQRNMNHYLTRSEIAMPSQDHKKDEDVKAILETQLLILESQFKFCRQDIKSHVAKDLRDHTLRWMAERADLDPDYVTDKYVGHLYEILAVGSTSHNPELNQAPGDVKGVRPEFLKQVAFYQHKIVENDEKFNNVPSRKAIPPKCRSGDIKAGAERLRSHRKDLGPHIPYDQDGDMSMR